MDGDQYVITIGKGTLRVLSKQVVPRVVELSEVVVVGSLAVPLPK